MVSLACFALLRCRFAVGRGGRGLNSEYTEGLPELRAQHRQNSLLARIEAELKDLGVFYHGAPAITKPRF